MIITLRTKWGVHNINNHLYTRKVIDSAIEEIRPLMEGKRFYGKEFDSKNISTHTSLMDVSFLILNMWTEDNGSIKAEIEILETEKGKFLKERLSEPSSEPGFGLVGIGSTNTNQEVYNYRLYSIESYVHEPFNLSTIFDRIKKRKKTIAEIPYGEIEESIETETVKEYQY